MSEPTALPAEGGEHRAPVESDDPKSPGSAVVKDESASGEATAPRWWHRDHPTFTALTGFYAGLVYILLVPSLVALLVGLIAGTGTAKSLLPFLGLALLVPVIVALVPRTRRFGLYMLLGVAVTVVTVGIVTAGTLLVLDRTGG